MAHTNSTSHYEYPQFIGTDKPGWLTDVNTAYSDIDGDIYTAQTKADDAYTLANTADGKADNATLTANSALTNAGTANTNIGTMANLETTEKTNLVGAINEVDGIATTNTSNINSLINKFNLNVGTDVIYNPNNNNVTFTNCTHSLGSLKVVRNSDDSLCKIYNEMYVNVTGANPKITVHAGIQGVTSEFEVLASGLYINSGVGTKRSKLVFKTNGDIEIPLEGTSAGSCELILNAVLIFIKSFGD